MKVSESTLLMITTKVHFYLPVIKLESHSKTGQIQVYEFKSQAFPPYCVLA